MFSKCWAHCKAALDLVGEWFAFLFFILVLALMSFPFGLAAFCEWLFGVK